MAKRPTDTDTNVNRIRSAVDEMTGLADPDDRMLGVLELLTPSSAREVIPGKIYLFIYNAKTPNILYDSKDQEQDLPHILRQHRHQHV